MGEEAYNNSVKADIIPIINAELQMNEERLFSLSIKVLNEIFNVLQLKVISKERLREIISRHSTSDAILNAIMKEPRSIPRISTPEVTPSPVEVPEVSPSPVDVPGVPTSYRGLSSESLFSQDSIKGDIIPVIQNLIDVDSEKLFSLSVDTLNKLFGLLESGTISNSEVESIINSSTDPADLQSRIQARLSTTTPTTDNFKEDLITGILFNIPESSRDKIELKVREITDINKLTELSQLDLPELQSLLGIEAPIPKPYDEGADIRAGILAQLPPSLRGVISDRLKAIDDLDQLYRLSQMNYVQIQQTLGLAPQSVREVPAEFANPVDTASRSSDNRTTPSTPSPSPEPTPNERPPQSTRLQAQLQQRREKNKSNVQIIQKLAEKIWKVKISEGESQKPEAAELLEKIEILQRAHPERVEKIVDHLKRTNDKNRFKALFDWYVFSHRIEEIETYVEHWQGQVQGIGGFRAAINVSRFDPIVRHLPTKEIQSINSQAKKALERVHSSDLNVRASGVEDIKQISNYLLRKAR
ncbi:MAG: hypothetical protein HWN66_12535 [Candidatus Helarchaeota archaeon]|nr:hypothetical protein [Candidatus Helarchaeota archaeon]